MAPQETSLSALFIQNIFLPRAKFLHCSPQFKHPEQVFKAEISCFILNLKISSLNCFLGRRRRMFETKTMLSQRIPLFLSVVLPYYLILFYCSGLYNEFAAKSQCFVTVYIPQGVMATEG